MSNLGNLLAWSIENSASKDSSAPDAAPKTKLNPELLAQLFGQKDEATMMREAMATIQDPEVSIENKEIAFDNFEMMIEQLDNANNIENLKLWEPLLGQLSSPHKQMRFAAAWCCGTAVQNNPKSQAAFFNAGGIPKMIELALKDGEDDVRKKAIFALSSAVRNSEENMKVLMDSMSEELPPGKHLTADDMEGIDALMASLRSRAAKVISQ